jgi:CTP:molybdopterin cytidylyltransferase MocA
MGCAVVDLVLAACQKAHLGRAFLVIRPDDNALRRHVASYGAAIQIVENPHAEFGQTSSLKAAIPFLPASCRTFLIYPVDYPLVRASDCARLLGAFESSEPGTLIAAPSFAGRRGHHVVVDARLGREFLALPDGGSAREVMNRHADRTAFVAMEDDRVLLDMDTPEDYAACLARFAREAGARPGEKGVS